MLEPITNHFHQALPKLVGPFWGKPRIASLLRAMVKRVQEFEDVCWEVLTAYDPEVAEGHPLDVIGKIVGQNNLGWTDDEYRGVIKARIRVNRSRGLADDLIEVIQLVVGEIQVDVNVYPFRTLTAQPLAALPPFQQEALIFLLPSTRPAATLMAVYFAPEGVGTFDFTNASGIDLDNVADPGTIAPGLYDVRIL